MVLTHFSSGVECVDSDKETLFIVFLLQWEASLVSLHAVRQDMAVWELYYEHQNITKNSTIQGRKHILQRIEGRDRGMEYSRSNHGRCSRARPNAHKPGIYSQEVMTWYVTLAIGEDVRGDRLLISGLFFPNQVSKFDICNFSYIFLCKFF